MLVAFMGLVGVASVSAQCSKSKTACTKSKAACATTVAKAASMDANIEKRICEKSGDVSFVRKSTCSVSGETKYTNVQYDSDSKKFVNVSPTHTSGKAAKKACAPGDKKGSCTGKAKATKTSASASTKKACCSKEAQAACSKKSASASAVKKTTTATAIKVSNK